MHDFWAQRWEQGRIGFHSQQVNPQLVKYADRLISGLTLESAPRILIPLCGKTVDITWLEDQGCDVVGVEIVEQALEDFHSEQGRQFYVISENGFNAWTSGRTALFQGDFFEIDHSVIGTVTGVWDRAALVAVLPELQQKYADQLVALTRKGARVLLRTFAYDQSAMQGPPWSVSPQTVQTIFGERFRIELLESQELIDVLHKFRDRGATSFIGSTWLLTRV